MAFECVAQLVHIPTEEVTLEGLLVIAAMAQGMVLFAHGSGSSYLGAGDPGHCVAR